MLKRYRWYRIRLPGQFRDFEEKINSYNALGIKDKDFGFVKHEVNELSPYQFFSKSRIAITKFDVNGDPYSEEVEDINIINFQLVRIKEFLFVRVENQGRSVRDLFNTLESIFGFGFTSKLVTFDRIVPLKIFECLDSYKLVGLKTIGVVIDQEIVARMDFVSKKGMDIEEIKHLQEVNYKIDYAAYELLYQGVKGQIAFTSGGVAKISGQLAPKLIGLIEDDLPMVVENKIGNI